MEAAGCDVGSAGFSTKPPTFISLAFDSNNIPYASYQEGNDRDITVMKYTASGTTGWENIGKAASGAEFISLVIDSNDTLYVAFEDWSNSHKTSVIVYK